MFALNLSDGAQHAVEVAIRVVVIIAVATLVRLLIHRTISRATSQMTSRFSSRTIVSTIGGALTSTDSTNRIGARANTIEAMSTSLATWIIGIVAALMVLGELDINLAPLLAGAGIAGIAIGFGAQNPRDVLAVLRAVEDQYGSGTSSMPAPASGTVERISCGRHSPRSRRHGGTSQRHDPPVGNRARTGPAIVEIVIPYSADVRKARGIMAEVAAQMATEEAWEAAMRVGGVADDQGISAMSPLGMTLRLVVDTEPKSQWGVERELRLRIKEAFDAAGIVLEVHQPPPPAP